MQLVVSFYSQMVGRTTVARFSARNDNIARPDRCSSLIRCDESTAVSATATHLKLVTPPRMDLEWYQVPVTNFRNLFPLHSTRLVLFKLSTILHRCWAHQWQLAHPCNMFINKVFQVVEAEVIDRTLKPVTERLAEVGKEKITA